MLFFFTGTLSEEAVNLINKQNDWCGMALSGMLEQVTNESVGTQDTVSTDCIDNKCSLTFRSLPPNWRGGLN